MDADDGDISILESEGDLIFAHGSLNTQQEFQVYCGGPSQSPSGVQDPYNALNLAYHDLKKRYNVLQERLQLERSRRRSFIAGDSMAYNSRTGNDGPNESATARESDSELRQPGINISNIVTAQLSDGISALGGYRLETDSCIGSTPFAGEQQISMEKYELLQTEYSHLLQQLEVARKEKNSLKNKLVGYEQVYAKITKGKNSPNPHGLNLERENLELHKQVKALEGALREKRRQDSVAGQNMSPRGRSPSSLESMPARELQEILSSVMTSKEQLRQLREQVRRQNDVIRMLICRKPQTYSSSAPNTGRWPGDSKFNTISAASAPYQNRPITDEEISFMGRAAQRKSYSTNSLWKSTESGDPDIGHTPPNPPSGEDSMRGRQAMEHTHNAPGSEGSGRQEPMMHSEINLDINSSGSVDHQEAGRIMGSVGMLNNQPSDVGASGNRLPRRGSEGAVGGDNSMGSPLRGLDVSSLEDIRRAKTQEKIKSFSRDYSRRRPLSDGTAYGEFDIGMTSGRDARRGDALGPLTENDTTQVHDEFKREATRNVPVQSQSCSRSARELENRFRPQAENPGPRQIDIERNIDYLDNDPTHSHDNTRQNININSGNTKFEADGDSPSHLASEHLGAVKPVPPQNIYNGASRNTVEKHPSNQNRDPCPVCRNFQSPLSEEMERHVQKCLQQQEEDLAEVARADTKSCPVCSESFPAEVDQSEYENHVYDHFRENPMSSFEMVNS